MIFTLKTKKAEETYQVGGKILTALMKELCIRVSVKILVSNKLTALKHLKSIFSKIPYSFNESNKI